MICGFFVFAVFDLTVIERQRSNWMKKVVTFLFFVAAITGQSWAFVNAGIDVFGFAHTYFPVLSISGDFLTPSESFPLSIGAYMGVGAIDIIEDRNNPPTAKNPNYNFNGMAMPLAARLGWHFTTSSDTLDLYALLSGGYFFTLLGPIGGVEPAPTSWFKWEDDYNLPEKSLGWPILEVGVGVRYYLRYLSVSVASTLENSVGVYAEVGFNPMPLIEQPLAGLWGIRIDMGITLQIAAF
jgi:hypothetical protein